MTFIAFCINATILEKDETMNLIGTSIGNNPTSMLYQLIVLINSIKKHIKNFNYDIHLFTTRPYNELNYMIFKNILNCYIYNVSPDVDDVKYNFFGKSKCFTHKLQGTTEYTHRIVLDSDMYFLKDLDLDFSYDCLMTYMPKYDLNTISKYDLDQHFKEAEKNYQKDKIIWNDDPLRYQYENNLDYVQIFPPNFNGGFIMINENISNIFGNRWKEIYTYNSDPNRGMYLQERLGHIIDSITQNWSSTPVGVNYFGEWIGVVGGSEPIMQTINYVDKISLVHYLSHTLSNFKKYSNMFENNNEFLSLIKRETCELGSQSSIINLIVKLKDQEWNFGIESQLKWFDDNVDEKDIHCLQFHIDCLIGYGLLRNMNDKYYILDTIIVDKNYRGLGNGSKIVNKLIENITRPIFLLCKEHNIPFYEKIGFNVNNKINFVDKNIRELKMMSINNNEKLEDKIVNYSHLKLRKINGVSQIMANAKIIKNTNTNFLINFKKYGVADNLKHYELMDKISKDKEYIFIEMNDSMIIPFIEKYLFENVVLIFSFFGWKGADSYLNYWNELNPILKYINQLDSNSFRCKFVFFSGDIFLGKNKELGCNYDYLKLLFNNQNIYILNECIDNTDYNNSSNNEYMVKMNCPNEKMFYYSTRYIYDGCIQNINNDPILKVSLAGAVNSVYKERLIFHEIFKNYGNMYERLEKIPAESKNLAGNNFSKRLNKYICSFYCGVTYVPNSFMVLKLLEITCSGSLLLADRSNETLLSKLGFVNSINCILVDVYNKKECVGIVKWILNPTHREHVDNVRRQGYLHSIKNFSLENNYNNFINIIDSFHKSQVNQISEINRNIIYQNRLFYKSYETVKYTYENLIGRDCPQYKWFGNLSHHINIPLFDLIDGDIYVEIGVHYGHSLSSMGYTFSNKTLIGIDLFDQEWFKKHGSIIDDVYKLVENNINKFSPSVKNNEFHLIKGDSRNNTTVQKLLDCLNNRKIDLLYIDGEHTVEAVKNDFELYFPFVKSGGLIVFDDYLPINSEVYKAVNDICQKYKNKLNIIGLTEDKGGYNKIKSCYYLIQNPPKEGDIVYNMDFIVQKI